MQAWFATIPLDENQKVGITQWVSTLEALNVLGTFTCYQGSDIVGDDRVGTEFKCRLSVPQAKAAFVNAQKESGGAVEDTSLDFDELLECIARCGVDKYRAVEQIKTGEKVSAMIANILGDLNEEQVITAATYITAERFTPAAAPPKGVSPDAVRFLLALESSNPCVAAALGVSPSAAALCCCPLLLTSLSLARSPFSLSLSRSIVSG